MDVGSTVRPSLSDGITRKKKRDPSKWRRAVAKGNRYEPSGPPNYPDCGHKGKPYQAYQCCSLTMQDIQLAHRTVYKYSQKVEQDTVILKFMETTIPKRKKNCVLIKGKSVSIKYFIIAQNKRKVPVCKKAFMGIFLLKKDRIATIGRNFFKTGEIPKEKRGGDHVSQKFLARRVAVRDFINSLHCVESHYCRGNSQRKYLPCELNIKKLWRIYNSSADAALKVKESLFRSIFNNDYNLGFGTPLTDACSTCLMLSEQLKQEVNVGKRANIMAQKRVHKLKAKAFYQLLKDPSETVLILSFDCQKNMPIPKVPDQKAYYSRQLYVYNLCIVEGHSKMPLTKENVFLYSWLENERPKSSNEIASCVYHRLNETNIPPAVKTLRLIADGCGGQNKNTILITMLMKWFQGSAPRHLKTIEVVFPVVGHSFMPPDRVFGNIEKIVKKKDTIVLPQGYYDIFEPFGTVVKISSPDFEVFDWRKSALDFVKRPTDWHFKFNPSKRMILKRSKKGNIIVRGEINYKSDTGTSKAVMKAGKNLMLLNPDPIPVGSNTVVKDAKLKDVKALLATHFGEYWNDIPELQFYTDICSRATGQNNQYANDVAAEADVMLVDDEIADDVCIPVCDDYSLVI